MFGDLPKILDRNFVIGFFLPAALLLSAIITILVGFDLLSLGFIQSEWVSGEGLTAAALFGTGSLVIGFVLLSLNYDIYRFLEGYPFNKLAVASKFQRKKYSRITRGLPIEQHVDELSDDDLRRLASRFPPGEEYVLPTAFGNTIRAFELYVKVMYGIDAIPGWVRLQSVIPKEYRLLIDEAKSLTDLWVNLKVTFFCAITTWIVTATATQKLRVIWLPIVEIGLFVVASARARSAAESWGNTVKAAFDVFLPRLHKKLEFPSAANSDETFNQWNQFSSAVIYRDRNDLPKTEAQASVVLVFQYGSNMDSGHLNSDKRLHGDARIVGTAHTQYDFELEFGVWSASNKCAAAGIVAGHGRRIWGVLYEVPEYLIRRETSGNRKSLDQIEAEGFNYWRTEIAVIDSKGLTRRATTYIPIISKPGLHTNLQYVKHILNGLREHGLPPDYVQYVKARIIGNEPSLQAALDQI